MLRHQRMFLPIAMVGLVAGVLTAIPAMPAMADPVVPTLVDIRAAHHPGYDRLVFEFSGSLPASRSVSYVDEVIGDGSGTPAHLAGNAFLDVRFSTALGHDDFGNTTYGDPQRAYNLPNIMEVDAAGDFEAHLTFGVGLAAETPLTVFTLSSPSRLVIDIGASFTTVEVQDYFIQNVSLDPVSVTRQAIPPATGKGALQRLFAGPTQAERAAGLVFVNSEATGFSGLSISGGIARVTLTGGCNSHGSTTTIANEIVPTLTQFPSVQWVKIYDQNGQTERPTGNSNSIPFCLEP